MKRFILLFLNCFLLGTSIVLSQTTVSKWNGKFPVADVETTYGGGNGSSVNPYQIATASDLALLVVNTNADRFYTTAKYFKLMTDIDLMSGPWTPIGINTYSPFKGFFDGNHKTITGLSISKSLSYAGLFGVLDSNAKVLNLNLKRVEIGTPSTNLGALVGLLRNQSTVKNCYTSGKIFSVGDMKNEGYVGGIVAVLESGTVTNCISHINIEGKARFMGGIAAQNKEGEILNSYNTGSLSTKNTSSSEVCEMGGICGQNKGRIISCFNVGTLAIEDQCKTARAGGIAGTNYNTISYTYSLGKIKYEGSKNMFLGALLGHNCQSDQGSVIEYSYHFGSKETQNSDNYAILVGNNYTSSIIRNCYTDKQVETNQTLLINGGGALLNSAPLLTREIIGSNLSNESNKYNLGDPSKWIFEVGLYPRLSAISEDDWVRLCASPFVLADPDNCWKVSDNFTVETKHSVQWSSSNTSVLKIQGNSATLTSACDKPILVTLTASLGKASKTSVIASAVANAGSIKTQGQSLNNRNLNITPITSDTIPSGGAFQWEVSVDNGTTYTPILGATEENYTPECTENGVYMYRRWVSVARCSYRVLSGGTWKLTLNYSVTIDKQPTADPDTICHRRTTTLGIQVSTTEKSVIYQWQSSSDGSDWKDIVNATNASYTTEPLTSTLFYRCLVSDNTGKTKKFPSQEVKVVVFSRYRKAAYMQPAHVCSGRDITLTVGVAGGSGQYTYKWYASVEGWDFDRLPINAPIYTFKADAKSYHFFKCTMLDNVCGDSIIDNTRVTIDDKQKQTPGEISNGKQYVCYNYEPFEIKSIQSDSSLDAVYQWKISKDSGRTFVDIVGATNQSYTPTIRTEIGMYIYTRSIKEPICYPDGTISYGADTIIIEKPFTATIAVTSDYNGIQISQKKATDGKIEVMTVSSIHKPYTYAWTPTLGNTQSFITNAGEGLHTVTIMDTVGCTATASATIIYPTLSPQSIGDTLRLYVTNLGDGKRSGEDWKNALPNNLLQDALNYLGTQAKNNTNIFGEIWLGVGLNTFKDSTYIRITPNQKSPFAQQNSTNPRDFSFVIPSGVSLYGGFKGNEFSKNDRTDRLKNQIYTLLSGYLPSKEKVYNVLIFGNGSSALAKPALVDGVVVAFGNANSTGLNSGQKRAGGVTLVGNSVFRSGIISECEASEMGGGAYVFPGAWLTGTLIEKCSAKDGGGVYTSDRATSITNATQRVNLVANTIVNNRATHEGSGCYVNNYTFMHSVVLWGNSINNISRNSNLKLAADKGDAYRGYDLNLHEFKHIAANDDFVSLYGLLPLVLSDRNKDPQGPNFLDEKGRVGLFGSIITGAYRLDSISPLIESAAVDLPDEASLAKYKLDVLDAYGDKRLILALDRGAFENQKPVKIQATNNRIYVSDRRRGNADGSSWANSTNSLQKALNYFAAKVPPTTGERFEIWISQGVYYPSSLSEFGLIDRNLSFILKGHTDIYGGFTGENGTEDIIDETTRPRIDLDGNGLIEAWEFKNKTLLSGVISVAGGDATNAYHVLYRDTTRILSAVDMILDGLYIADGNADGKNQDCRGSGIYAVQPITIRNCALFKNKGNANTQGVAIYSSKKLNITNSYIGQNTLLNNDTAAALYLHEGGVINQCVIAENTMIGVAVTTGNLEVSQSTLVKNKLAFKANSMSLNNTVIWGNTQNQIEGTPKSANNNAVQALLLSGRGNISLDEDNMSNEGPRFKSIVPPYSYYPYCASPLVDKGAETTIKEDITNRPRKYQGFVDIGAYESQIDSLNVGTIDSTGDDICYHTSSSVEIANLKPASGGTPPFIYEWTANGQPIANSNSLSLLPSMQLTENTIFKRLVSDNECNSKKPSNGQWVVKVYDEFKVKQKGKDTTICFQAPLALQVDVRGGKGTPTYQWQKSLDNKIFTNLEAADASSVSMFALITDTVFYMRCQVNDSKCGEVYSDTLKIRQYAEFKAGSIDSTGQNICQAQANAPIKNLTAPSGGQTPYTYSWYVSGKEIVSEMAQDSQYTPSLTAVGTHIYQRYVSDSICQTQAIASQGEWKLSIQVRPSVTIVGDTSIDLGQSAKLKLLFKGTPPFLYRFEGDTKDRTSTTSNLELVVSPLETRDYHVVQLSDATACNAKAEDMVGNARVNVYCQFTLVNVNPTNALVEAYQGKTGLLIDKDTKFTKWDTVWIKIKPKVNCNLKSLGGILYNDKDSTAGVCANYAAEDLYYRFEITENVVLKVDVEQLTPWNGQFARAFRSESGDSILIFNPVEFAGLAQESDSNDGFKNKFIKLCNDLDLKEINSKNLIPIGSLSKPFEGSFDGNSKKLSNLRMVYKGAKNVMGLFGCLGSNAYVHNFTIQSGIISSDLDYVGAVAGKSNGHIDSVYNYAQIIGGRQYVGGLVGMLDKSGKITNSYNAAPVSVLKNGMYVGGLVGQSAGLISHSFNIAHVLGSTKVGGLIGETLPTAVMEYCYNAGASSGQVDVNGFIGFNSSDSIRNSYTFGGYKALLTTQAERKYLGSTCYTDIQMTKTPSSELMSTAKKTREMTGTALQDSLGDNTQWVFEDLRYPSLKSMQNLEATSISVLPIFINDKERKDSLKSNFTYPIVNDVVWTSSENTIDPITLSSGTGIVSRSCKQLNQIDTVRITKGKSVRALILNVLSYPAFSPGEIDAKGENICFKQKPTLIGETKTAQGSETNMYTYSWYKNGQKVESEDAKGATYMPKDSLSGIYVYMRKVSENNCNTGGEFSKGQWTLEIKPDLKLIKYTGTADICYGTKTSLTLIPEGGDGVYTYQWEQSSNDTIWGPAVAAADTALYITPVLYDTNYFRCVVTSCGLTDTLKGIVSVYDQFQPGKMKVIDTVLCYGEPCGLITIDQPATGGLTPYEYRWKRITKDTVILAPKEQSYNPTAFYPLLKDTVVFYVREVRDNKCNTKFEASENVAKLTTYPKFKASIAITSNYFGLPLSGVGAQDGSVEVAAIGGGGKGTYTYSWKKNDNVMSGENTSEIKNLSAGVYEASIQSMAQGKVLACSPITQSITINPIEIVPKQIHDTMRLYVTYMGEGKYDGSSWKNALPNILLQASIDHLDQLQKINPNKIFEIWLGLGVDFNEGKTSIAYFYPSKRSPYVSTDIDPRAKSFVLPQGINLFGAFYGIENTKSERTSRSSSRTILSGYFSNADRLQSNFTNRVYNVLVFGDGKKPFTKPTVIDGVSLMHGNANHPAQLELQQGGGTTLLENVIMRNSYAGRNYAKRGGGVYMKAGAWLVGSLFYNDTAEIGGGVYVETPSNGNISNTNQRANIVGNTIVNCFANDQSTATTQGAAGLYLGDYVFMANTVAWNNQYNGVSANNNVKTASSYDVAKHLFQYVAYNDETKSQNINKEILLSNDNTNTAAEKDKNPPLFTDPYSSAAITINGFGLQKSSSLSFTNVPSTVIKQTDLAEYALDSFDYAGNIRLVGDAMDIGAYEMQNAIELQPFEGRRLYVSHNPKGLRDGSSWENAGSSIQFALDYFEKATLPSGLDFFEIWVSKGDYIPVKDYLGDGDRDPKHRAFILNDKTHLYGGFEGTEKSITDRKRSDLGNNAQTESWQFVGATKLTGEIVNSTSLKQHVNHVVYRPKTKSPKNIILDGFVIQNSLALDSSVIEGMAHSGGGGILALDSIQIQNCAFYEHQGRSDGDGIGLFAKNALIKNCFFAGNGAGASRNENNLSASVIYLENSRMQSSLVINNYMAGIKLVGDNNVLLNNTVIVNNAGIRMPNMSSNTIINNVIWKNYTFNQKGDTICNEIIGSSTQAYNNAVHAQIFGTDGINLSIDPRAVNGPRFVSLNEDLINTIKNNLTPDYFSPLLNVGKSVDLNNTKDLAEQKRVYGTAIDLGAFESQVPLLDPGVIDSTGETICYRTIPTLKIKGLRNTSGGPSSVQYIWYANGSVIQGANEADYQPRALLTRTTIYERAVISHEMENISILSKGAWTITVRPRVSLTLNAPQILCYNTSSVIYAKAMGGDDHYTYEWSQKKGVDDNTKFTKIPNESGDSLPLSALKEVMSYSCTVNSCNGSVSNGVEVAVYPELIVQKQLIPATICHNSIAILSTLGLGGTGTYVYTWQKRNTESEPWIDIPNSDQAEYRSEPLTISTYFRCKIHSCGNDAVFTNPALITVLPQMKIEKQSTDDTICYQSTTTLDVKMSGGNGKYNYLWQKADLNGSNWQDAPGENTSARYSTEKSLLTPFQYRCKVISACDDTTTLYSQPIKLSNYPELRIVSMSKVSDTFCYNTKVNPLSVQVTGGDKVYEYEWKKQLADYSWSVEQRSADSTYQILNKQTQTQRYHCNVYSCGNIRSSDTLEVFIRPQLDGGEIARATSSICFGDTVPLIKNIQSPSGGSGHYTITWVDGDLNQYAGSSYEFQPDTTLSPGTYFFQRFVEDKVCGLPMAWSAAYKLVINQTPLINKVNDQVLCATDSSQGIVFASPNTEGQLRFKWTSSHLDYGLSAEGVDSIPSFIVLNPTYAPVNLKVKVQPILINEGKRCVGDTISFQYHINPSPQVNPIEDKEFCSGTSQEINFTSLNQGGLNSFAWSSSLSENSMSYIGLPSATGTGDIHFIAANNQSSPQYTKLMVSPSFTAYGKTCIGSTSKQISIRLTSKPTPVLSSPKTFAPLCSGNHFYYDPASNVKATIFMWKRPALTNINEGFEKNGIERIEDTLFNKGTQIQKVKYEYTLTANGCTNTQKDTVQMDVYPYFNKGNIGTSHQTVCNNTPIQQAEPTQAEGGNGAIFYEWRMKKDTNAEQVVSTTANYQIPATIQAGVYTYTRWTKNETCQSTWIQSEGEYIITVLPALQATIAVTSNFNGLDIEEPGINNGRAKVVVNGGVEPYSYLWSSSETIDSIQNKAPGTYSVSVYDANKCSLTKSISIKPIVFTPQIIEDTSRFYVTYLGDGLRDGSSWKNAFPRQILQYALDTAGEIARYPKKQGEIWLGIGENYVIAGKGVAKFSPNSIYKYSPFVNDTNDPRAKSFVVPSGVGLFGNFAGHESSKKRPRRNSYMTVLSGDLKQTPDNTEDDAYNVLVFGDGVNGLSKPAYVNGVEITSGNANHPKNASMQLGGAIVAVDNATIQSVLVMHNKAKKGAVYMQGQSYLNSSLLYANTAEQGGAIYTKSYRDFNNGPVIAYNTIVNNQASTNGAGVYLNPYVVFVGNVVWNNSIDGISENNNIAFYVNDKNRYKIDYVFANDSAIQMMSSTSVKLSNSNRDTLNGGPMFADPLNDTGRVSPYQSLAFMLTDYSPMRNSLILPNPEYAPRFLRLEDYDLYGAPRQAANNSIDFNAAEYGKHEPLQPTLNRLYVSSRRKGLANGSSWANTTNNLSEAVAYFYKQTPTNGERFEVWVSDGTFFPRTPTSTNTDTRKMAFVLNENIDIYGGFRGLEGDENQMDSITRPRSDYNGDGNIDAWEYTYMTTLSGNVNPANGNLSSYHVLYRTQGSLQSTLDGLRVVSGNANGPTLEDQLGGGLYTQQAIKIKHCAFKANAASKTGNGAAVYAVNSLIDASYFISNYIDGENADTNLTTGVVAMNGGIIQNSVIQKNHTSGVFALGDKAPTILNTTIVGNTAGIIDMADANTQIKNSIIWDNKRTLNANTEYAAVLHLNGSMDVLYSAVDDAAESLNGEFIIELNKDNVAIDGPQFTKVNAPDNNNNYRLNCKSMLINLGNTFQWTDQDLDFAARARIVETVDMGAYETQHLDLQGGEIQSTGERICYNSVPTQTIKSISVAQGGSGQNTYYWYYNDTLIEGATQASYLPTQTLTADAVYTRRSYNDCGLETPAQGKWQVKVSALPSVSLSGDAKINKGEAAILKLAFTGTAPFTYRLSNDVNDRIHNSQDTLFLELYPNISTVYKVISLFDSNACTVPSDSLKGEAYVSVAEYVDISFERTFNGTILPSKSGRMLKGTPVSVTIRPNDSYYLQKLLAGTQKDTINRTSLPLYLDAENNSLVIDFIATQDSNIMAIFAPVSKWKNNLEDLRFTKDSNTVYIYSPGELASLAQQTNVYKKTYSQVQVKLMRDLDMGGVQDSMGVWDRAASAKWIPIASDSLAHFHGEFDGNNKQIKNLYVNVLQDNAGLFGALGRWAFVKNLAITSGFIRGENNVGSIAGILYSNANIAEVFSMASIEATQTHAGGLVGVNYGSIENAYNVGLVQATEYVGGIAGENRGSIANTYNVGQVKGTANVFSISSSKGKIENSYYEPQLIGLDYQRTTEVDHASSIRTFDTIFENLPLWVSHAKHYPSLRCFDATDFSTLSIANVLLDMRDNVDALHFNITICQDPDLKVEVLNAGRSVANVTPTGIDITRSIAGDIAFVLKLSKATYSRYINMTVATLHTSYTHVFDTICNGTTYWFLGKNLSQTGIYKDTIFNNYEDDSIVTLSLFVMEEEKIEMQTKASLCATQKQIAFDMNILSGHPILYSLSFDSLSKTVGFIDCVLPIVGKQLIVPLPHTVIPPNDYTVMVNFKNAKKCASVPVKLTIKQNFEIERMAVKQKGDYLLYLKNSDHNGGYNFKSYQWFVGDDLLEQETKSYYYAAEGLRTDIPYHARLELMQGTILYTCPFVAIRGGQTVQMFPSQVGRAQNYTISLINFEVMPTDGQIELYNMQGSLLERNPLKSTQTTFEAPSYTGTYLIKVIIPNKDIYTFKLIVN